MTNIATTIETIAKSDSGCVGGGDGDGRLEGEVRGGGSKGGHAIHSVIKPKNKCMLIK